MIRDLVHRLAEMTPARRRKRRELEEAHREAALTSRREIEVENGEREARRLAWKLSEHRRQNHFEQRMRAAYQGKGHAT